MSCGVRAEAGINFHGARPGVKRGPYDREILLNENSRLASGAGTTKRKGKT